MPVVEFSLKKALKHFTKDRAGLLTKCTPIDLDMAKKLVDHGYRQSSKFKKWCPIEVNVQVLYVSHNKLNIDTRSHNHTITLQ